MSFDYVEERVAVWDMAGDDHLANPGHHHLEPWELPLSAFPSMGSLVTGRPLDGGKTVSMRKGVKRITLSLQTWKPM